MDVKAAPNGVATIEDRILRITGYYGYYPGYSSQKSKTPRGRSARGADGRWAGRQGRIGGAKGATVPDTCSPACTVNATLLASGTTWRKVCPLSSVLNLETAKGPR
jgi:hypothetical protein